MLLLQTKLGFLQQPRLSIREKERDQKCGGVRFKRERDVERYFDYQMQIGPTESFDRSLFLPG